MEPWRRAKDLITSFGAQQIGELTWRGSYALIGVKDGTAWAEAIAIAGDGMAVAVAVVPWQELPPEMLPWCDAKAPMLATKGEMHSSGNLEIQAASGKCRYQVFEEESAKTCFWTSGSVDLLLGQSETDLILTCSIRFNDYMISNQFTVVIPKTRWNLRFLLFGFVPFGAPNREV